MGRSTLAALGTILLTTACATQPGQKVTVYLTTREVVCIDDGAGGTEAKLTLDQREDFYLAEFSTSSGSTFTLDGVRDGLTVTFPCPKGITNFKVRHATVIQSRRDYGNSGAPADGGDGGDAGSGGGGGGGAPGF